MRDELIELLDLGDLVNKPVRNLSLGERMKVEIADALLHRPGVLFLDEPTLGLDVTMQRRIRSFVGEYNRRHGATVLLTSHYMADVQALCKRGDRHPPRAHPLRRRPHGLVRPLRVAQDDHRAVRSHRRDRRSLRISVRPATLARTPSP